MSMTYSYPDAHIKQSLYTHTKVSHIDERHRGIGHDPHRRKRIGYDPDSRELGELATTQTLY